MAAPPPRYKIKLTAAERRDLERLTKTDKTSARKFAIARALAFMRRGGLGSRLEGGRCR